MSDTPLLAWSCVLYKYKKYTIPRILLEELFLNYKLDCLHFRSPQIFEGNKYGWRFRQDDMNRKGAFMPPGTPSGDFQMKMTGYTMNNDVDHYQNHHNHHSHKNHQSAQKNTHYFNQKYHKLHLKPNHVKFFSILCFFIVFVSMPGDIVCQEINSVNGDNLNGFSLGPEYITTTTEFGEFFFFNFYKNSYVLQNVISLSFKIL